MHSSERRSESGARAASGLDPGLGASFVIALAGTLGSLYASEVLGYRPCVLCWYQRIAMYPLALVFFVALWSGDRGYARYSLPLCALGVLLAAYHNLIYYGVIPETISPCQQGVSCATRQLEVLGFVTIPLMSLFTFTCLGVLGAIALRREGSLRG
jgi:disulfide bond formation protein DsbB